MYLGNYIVKGGKNRSLLADRWENNSNVSSRGLKISNNWAGRKKEEQRGECSLEQ